MEAAPPGIRLGIAIALVGVVGALDAATGSEVSFSIFYLMPVAFAGRVLTSRAGAFVALLAAALWGYLDITMGRPYSAAWIPYWNSAVRLGFFLIVNATLASALRAHARERAMSRIDSLTGLANARSFEELGTRVIAESRRSGRPFTLAYVDLDRFKEVNDQLGHSEGDRVLRSVAEHIADSARATDVVARLGGDEFVILMAETGVIQAHTALERIAAAVAAGTSGQWNVGATFGAVTFTEAPHSIDSAVRQADALMYQGKAEGRGRILQTTWPTPSTADRTSACSPTTPST